MKKQTTLFFYLLGVYVVLQFSWWGYHLIDLSNELQINEPGSQNRTWMVVGEGSVFLALLIFGLWRIRRSIKKELELSQQQSNFLLSVTHELKTPIASNRLYLQTLLKRVSLSEEKRESLLHSALTENKRLQDMIENILTATQLDNRVLQLNKSEENIALLAQDLVQKWSKQRCDISVINNVSRNVNVDRVLLEIMIINLLENALKYAKGKGINLSFFLEENNLQIIVCDTGPGIAKEEQKQIFKKFYRAGNEETRTEKGTGLGLYIVSELVKIHNGKISYQNNEPNGACFKIVIENV
ncbi:MAG: sensor histidine kinase [Lishizhenia sp.]